MKIDEYVLESYMRKLTNQNVIITLYSLEYTTYIYVEYKESMTTDLIYGFHILISTYEQFVIIDRMKKLNKIYEKL
jgi:hypothetical protein